MTSVGEVVGIEVVEEIAELVEDGLFVVALLRRLGRLHGGLVEQRLLVEHKVVRCDLGRDTRIARERTSRYRDGVPSSVVGAAIWSRTALTMTGRAVHSRLYVIRYICTRAHVRA